MSREALAKDIWLACDIMRRDNNCGGVMEYVEHLSWLLFLRFLDGQEDIFEAEAKIKGRTYQRILDGIYRWSYWARKDWGTGGLLQFAHGELIPYLRGLSGSPERDIIRGIFADRNVVVCASEYNLKDVIQLVDVIDFQNPDDIHTVSFVYEDLLKKLGSENRLAGEFYTPRPIIRFMVQMVDPRIGETVYDPACGTCGFLAEAYLRMKQNEASTRDHEQLQRETFFGNEKKPVPALLGVMNMVLHGILAPNIRRRNTLEENIREVSEHFNMVLTNPPFGGKENKQVQQNFPVKSQQTELLFLEHVMKKLKPEGRCGMVVPEGTLFRGDAFTTVKKDLLENFNLHSIVSLPAGVFLPYAGVKTNLMFFDRTGPTREIWYYELLPPPENGKYTKGKPVRDEHFVDCRAKFRTREISAQSWVVPAEEIAKRGFDLTAKNPNRPVEAQHRPPEELVESILKREQRIAELMAEIKQLL
jgi:type I restriction enzyme M protein